MKKTQGAGRDRPVYMISVAAELAGMHPQTLRIYERKRLVQPQRSAGNTRLYSDADIERLRLIQHLTQEEGINLAGMCCSANEVTAKVAAPFNRTKKYVVSHESFEPTWSNSVCIAGDVVSQIKALKEQDGPDLWVWGSGNLIQTLLKHNIIDRMHLWIYPITIGTGKKLLAEGTQPETFKLIDSKTGPTGVILATYEPAGPLKQVQ